MKGLLFKSSSDQPAESYPLTTLSGQRRGDTPSHIKTNSEGYNSTNTNNEEGSQTPSSPDSQTPLKNNLRSSNYFPSFTPSIRRRKGSMVKGNIVTTERLSSSSSSTGSFYLFLEWMEEKLAFLVYYLRYAWFLMKCASSRTVTLPIGFSTPPSLEKGIQTTPVLIGYTLGLFSPQNFIRRSIASLFRSAYTDVFLTLVIIIHWAALLSCTWVPGERISGEDGAPEAKSTDRPWINFTLLIVFCIYTLEAVARMIVGGVFKDGIRFPRSRHSGEIAFGEDITISHRIYSTRSAYLRRSFNRLDIFCIICFWVQVVLEHYGKRDLYFLSALSALRIFRLLNFATGSQVILKSLKASAPLLANVALIIGFFILGYSVLGTTFFRTSLKSRCVTINNETNQPEPIMFERFCGSYINQTGGITLPVSNIQDEFYFSNRLTTGYSCPIGQTCVMDKNPNDDLTSFDNIQESFIYVFIIGSGQSWSDILYQLASSTTRGSSLYFVIVILTLNFWLLNMFVAVITEVFANLRSSQSSAFVGSNSIDLFKDDPRPYDSEGDFDGQAKREGGFYHEGTSTWALLKGLVNSRLFELFWVLVVIANMVVLGSRTSKTTATGELSLARGELALSILFAVEIILRYIFWTRPGGFMKRGKNRLDGTLAVLNLVAALLKVFGPDPVYRYLVVFQLLRVYRVVWCIPNVRELLTKVAGGTTGILNMVFFVFMMIFLCCGIAMQLFGGTLNEEDDGEKVFPRFDSIGWSFLGLYQVFSGEDWSSVLFLTMKGQNGSGTVFAAVIFVIMFFGLSNFILLNLFVAVLVENLEISESSKRRIQLEGYFKGIKTNYRRINAYLSPWNVYRYVEPEPQQLRIRGLPNNLVLPVEEANAKQFLAISHENARQEKPDKSVWARIGKLDVRTLNLSGQEPPSETPRFTSLSGLDLDTEPLFSPLESSNDAFTDAHLLARDEFYDAHPSYDKPLFLFSRQNKFRRFCQILAGSEDHPGFPLAPFTLQWLVNRLFFGFMVIAVLTNVCTTLLQTPEKLSDVNLTENFKFIDAAFLIIFSFDVTIHVVADGMLFTPNAYLFSAWNLFYFLALVISYVDYFAVFQKAEGLSRLARAGKAFRVLRLINFSNTAKFTLNAVLVSGFWKLFDAASIAMCFLIPWAIYLQNVFGGRFYSCNDDDVAGIAECIGEFVDPELNITMPRSWANPWKYSFDDFPSALRILFEITSGEGWTDVMKQCMSTTGPDIQPKQFASPLNSLLIVTFNFMVSVSILSLFVSIVIDNFTTRSGSALLAVEQRRWKDLSKLLRNITPPKVRRTPPGNPFMAWLYRLATAKRSWLTKLMAVVHLLILAILATERVSASETEILIKVYMALGLMVICVLDILLRLIGLGPLLFLSNAWNLLQFLLVSAAMFFAIVQASTPQDRIIHNLFNFLLVMIAMRSMAMFDGLHQLFQTLRASVWSIINLLFVWLILFFIYATIFMQVFGMTRIGPNGSENMANFRDPINALMMLVRFSQGEAWNSVMYDYTVQPPYCVIDNPTLYLASDCGSPAWSYALFMSFNILSMYIFLNMFVGVIVDNFSYCYQLADDDVDKSSTTSDMLSRSQTRSFKQAWITFDPKRTGYLRSDSLVPFLLSLSPPFDLKIYESLYTIRTLVESSFHLVPGSVSDKPHLPIEATDVTSVHLKVLNSLLRTMDTKDCNLRRRRLNIVFHECLVFAKPGKGIQFTDALLVLARHKLIDPQSAFSVEELVNYNQVKEQVYHRLNMEKVIGTLRMLVLRRRFLKHLESKRSRPNSSVPSSTQLPHPASFEKGSTEDYPSFLETSDIAIHPVQNSILIDGDSETEPDQESAAQYLQQLQLNPWSRILSQQTGTSLTHTE